MVDKSGGYNLPEVLCIRGKARKVTKYEGCCRIKPNKGPGGPQWIGCKYRYSTRRRKNARRSGYRNNWLIQSSNAKEFMIFKSRDQKQTLWLSMDKLNRLRMTINQGLIYQTLAHVRSDIWTKGRILNRTGDRENSQTNRIKCSKLRWQRMLMSIARHTE